MSIFKKKIRKYLRLILESTNFEDILKRGCKLKFNKYGQKNNGDGLKIKLIKNFPNQIIDS